MHTDGPAAGVRRDHHADGVRPGPEGWISAVDAGRPYLYGDGAVLRRNAAYGPAAMAPSFSEGSLISYVPVTGTLIGVPVLLWAKAYDIIQLQVGEINKNQPTRH